MLLQAIQNEVEYNSNVYKHSTDELSVISLERYRRQTNISTSDTTTSSSSGRQTSTTQQTLTTSPDLSAFNYQHDDHVYYQSETVLLNNHVDDFWVELINVTGHETLSDSHRTAVTATLPFNFPFYGHKISNVTIATGGFLYMSPFLHQWLTATQYIAPLMANFDTEIGNRSEIIYMSYGSRFVVEWRNVFLQDQNTSAFRFQAILHKNGSIVFVYKNLPIPITNISDIAHPVKIGLSDAFYFDTTSFGTRRRTIYEYHRVSLDKQYIQEGSVVMMHPLPTCNLYSDCETCISSNINFECKWCGIINRCSDSVDWHRQEWLDAGCVHLSGSANCSLIPTVRPGSPQVTKSNTTVAVVVIIVVVLIALIGAVGAWVYYAYTHPTSASGVWLIEHRPSQMKAKLNNMKFWKRNTAAGDKYAVESTA